MRNRKRRVYSEEKERFLLSFIPGHTSKEIIAEYNKRFSEPITIPKLDGFKRHNKIHSGLPKGKNSNPIGHERIKNGFIIVKTEKTPSRYKLKHYVLWEKVNGPVPEGYKLIFLDGNKRNFHLENFALVTKEELGIMAMMNLQSEFAEITKTGILIARVIAAKKKAEKKRRENREKRAEGDNERFEKERPSAENSVSSHVGS